MRVRRWMVLVLALNLVAGAAIVVTDKTRAAATTSEAGAEKVTAPVEREAREALGMAGRDRPKTMYDVWETVALAISVSFVTGVSIVGAGIAVGKVGSAAIGAAAEKPELLTRSLLFVALAEGLAVLGFAVAMMLLAKM